MNRIRNRKCIGKRIRIGKKIGKELSSKEDIELVKELRKRIGKVFRKVKRIRKRKGLRRRKRIREVFRRRMRQRKRI